MDEETVERIGVQPLLDELATVDAAADATELAAVLGGLQHTGVGGGAGAYIDTDSKDSTRYLLHLSQSGLGLPDESYYRDEQHADILAGYPRHIAAMFARVYGGAADDHADTAARIVALESKLAAAHWDVVKRRDADLTYNLRAFADLPDRGSRLRLGRLGDRDGRRFFREPGAASRTRCAPTRLPDRSSRRCGPARTSRTGNAGPAGG